MLWLLWICRTNRCEVPFYCLNQEINANARPWYFLEKVPVSFFYSCSGLLYSCYIVFGLAEKRLLPTNFAADIYHPSLLFLSFFSCFHWTLALTRKYSSSALKYLALKKEKKKKRKKKTGEKGRKENVRLCC